MLHDFWTLFLVTLVFPTAGDRFVLELRYRWKYKLRPRLPALEAQIANRTIAVLSVWR